MTLHLSFRALPVATALACLAAALPVQAAPGKVEFNRDIRPVMSDTCFHCHGPDAKARKSDLRLDIREEALKPAKSGAIPIVPGKPDESEIIKRIFAKDADDLMPPEEIHKALTSQQKEMFRQWVAEGANYQVHWAYTPLAKPAVPKPASRKATVVNNIDAFVLARLEAKSIAPSKEADKRQLLRRLSLDLTGLPPTPEEVNAFLADKSSKAYERQVDRLLKSPQFGERMAVWWLDVVRFADTVGFHGDQNQRIFPYRDYIINAFNSNKPFNQFTLEQIAGDLLPNPTKEQLVATGFNRLNMVTREGGAQAKEYLAKYAADRVRTVGGAWLGSTLGCTECHDHKFDPFKSRDFYSLAAFFADVKQWGIYSDYSYTPNPELKGWSNDHPFPPEVEVPSPYLQQRQARFENELHALLAAQAVKLAEDVKQQAAFESWVNSGRAFLQSNPDGWSIPAPTVETVKSGKASVNTNVTVSAARVIQFSKGKAKKGDETRVSLPLEAGRVAAIRMEAMPGERDEDNLNFGSQRQGIRLMATLKPQDGKERKLAIYHADADFKEPRYGGTEELVGVKDGWKLSSRHGKNPQTSVWMLDPPVTVAEGDTLLVTFGGDTLLPLRLAVSPFAAMDPLRSGDGALRKALQTDTAKRKPEQRALLSDAFLLGTAWNTDAFAKFKTLQREILECHNGRAWSMVTESVQPLKMRVLPRGNWQDESGQVVQPATPGFLPGPNDTSRSLSRLDLAKWLCSPENPLTARTVMNRLWKQFYGNALSSVVDDLGAQGEPPSHPELLDWIAAEFRDSGWDMKHMIKLMTMSATYRQDSSLRPELKDIDPNNRLLASQNPRRLDAEFVRDNALFIAGKLNLDLGGPSAKPYQPAGYYANIQFPNRDYVADTDERQYRRGLYMHWQRTFLHPMLANFDAPGREECTANRVVSNTPQQALTLLNDPVFVEAARVFAERLLHAKTSSDDERITLAYQQALAREPKSMERESLKQLLAGQRDYYKENAEEAAKFTQVGLAKADPKLNTAELAAWTSVCRVVLNLHETITRY